MSTDDDVRREIVIRTLGHPVVVAPTLLGATALAAAWALSIPTGIGVFALVAGLLGSAGAYTTRLVLDGGRTAKKILDERELKKSQARQAALDDLDRRLTTCDKDPKPETALRDIRELAKAIDRLSESCSPSAMPAAIDIRSKAFEILDQSVRALEATIQLGETASRLAIPSARKAILQRRKSMVEEVEASAKRLGEALAGLQRLDAADGTEAELGRIRSELDESLRIAAAVGERMNSILDGTSNPSFNDTLQRDGDSQEQHVKS